MTHDWRAQERSSWLRPSAALIAAVLFLGGLAGFLVTLLRPFDDARLYVLTCDGDPATAGAAPLEQLAAANSSGTISRRIDTPPGYAWLEAIEDFGRQMSHRDTVVVSLRGAWLDQPDLALGSLAKSGRTKSDPLRIADVISQVEKLPADKVILCLDDADPALDQFSERLKQAQEARDSNRVVIIAAHRLGEESFPLPGRQCTAFAQVIAQAFTAKTDRDHDGVISLKEFLSVVPHQVNGWAAVLTGGRESQTPLIIAGTPTNDDAILCPVLQQGQWPASGENGNSDPPEDGATALSERLTASWKLCDELISQSMAGDLPLVICRSAAQDLRECERRWRMGESSDQLKDALSSLQATLLALREGTPLPPLSPQWAIAWQLHSARNSKSTAALESDTGSLAQLEQSIAEAATMEAVEGWVAQNPASIASRTRLLIQKFAQAPDIPEDLWKDVLLTRINLDRLDRAGSVTSWAAAERTMAERAALRSERLVLDQIERDWVERSTEANEAADAALARIAAVKQLQVRANQLCRRTLLVLPDLLDADERLQFWENDPSEVGALLDGMLESLALLRVMLRSEKLNDAGPVERLAQAIETDLHQLLQPVHQITAQVSTSASPPPALEYMRLLRSNLLSIDERIQLLAAWQRMTAEIPEHPPRPTAAGRVIVRGLAEGLVRNANRRVRATSILFDASAPPGNAAANTSLNEDMSLLDFLQQFHSERERTAAKRPGAIRQELDRLLASSITPDNFRQGRVLWDAFDGLQNPSQLPPLWMQLADQLEKGRRIHHINEQIRLVSLARDDASPWEQDCYGQQEADLRAARSSNSQWPAPDVTAMPRIHGPETLPLQERSDTELTFEVEGAPQGETCDLTVQYDDAQYIVSTTDGRQILPMVAPPQPYVETTTEVGVPVQLNAPFPQKVALRVQPLVENARTAPLLVRLRGKDWTARAMCRLIPPSNLPIELILEDEFGPVIRNGRGWTVEPYPNRISTLRWSLRNLTSEVQQARLSIYVVDAPPASLPKYAIPTDSLPDVLKSLPRHSLAIEVPVIELAPNAEAKPVAFPKQDDTKSSVAMQGGFVVALSDESTQLTRLQTVRFLVQRPQRFVIPTLHYERTEGRITLAIDAKNPERLPPEGVAIAARLRETPNGPRPARTTGRLSADSPGATITLLADPQEDHRVELDIADWPRAFVYEIVDGEAALSHNSSVRVTTPRPGTLYQKADAIPVHMEIDTPTDGFLSPNDWFEVGVDANHDRRLHGENSVRISHERSVTVHWLGAAPDGSTPIQVRVGDFDLDVPTHGLRNQSAALLCRVVRAGQRDVWGAPVPLVFDSSPPQLSHLKLQPGPAVVIGEPVALFAEADDGGLSGISQIEVGFDPSRSGRFDSSVKPVTAVPLEGGGWRAELPTDKLEQGRHLLLARAVDKAGNAETPHSLWIEAITAEEAAHRQAERTIAVSGQILYGTQPVPGIKVRLVPNPGDDAAPSEPMNMEKSLQPEKSFAASSGKDGSFVFPAVIGGQYTLSIEGSLRGEKFDRQSPMTIDVDNPPSALSVRLDRPPAANADSP